MMDAGTSLPPWEQLSAVINPALDLLEYENIQSAKGLLRTFSSDLAGDGPSSGRD